MSTTAAYPASMADLKGPADATHWNPYSSALPMSTARYSLDHHHRPRSSIDAHHNPYPYAPRYPEDPAAAAAAHHPPPLATTHSFPNLKRTYSQTQEPAQPAYTEIVQDLRDDGSKLGVNHDHKLLSFKRTQDKHTLVDGAGRIQQLELQAQLHGMFFLSEMPSSTPDGTVLQPELTCYRRNLFQISGSLITPRGQLSVLTPETGETVAVQSTEVTISAIESVDGHPVRLIVIPWKTPPPNSPEISQSPDQEPPTLPLIPFQDDGPEAQDGEYAVYPIGWRRLQFRIATANNGRRKELQQHFILHLKVVGTLANGTKVVLTESTTAPIVVRGRSPRNFQARKEIPLLGSSAGSRGQALVETGLGIVAGPLAIKPGDAKARALNLELPRTAFTFNATKLPGSPMAMRSNSYPAWTSQGQVPLSQMPASATAAYPPTSISDSYPKVPLSGAASFTAEPQEMPLQTTMPPPVVSLTTDSHPPTIRTQYAYAQSTTAPPPPMSLAPAPAGNGTTDNTLAVPRYVDSNPRPSKSPRTAGHQSVHSSGSLSNEHSEYRYGPSSYASTSGEMGHGASTAYSAAGSNGAAEGASAGSSGGSALPPRDYLPPTNTWATTAGEASAASVSYTNGDSRPYAFSDYKTGGVKTDGPAHTGTGYAATGMSHYSWSSA